MRGFIYIRPLGLGADILVGLAQIASVEPVQRKRRGPYFAELHLGDGRIVQAEESWEEIRKAIEDAEFGPEEAEPLPVAAKGAAQPTQNGAQTAVQTSDPPLATGLAGTFTPPAALSPQVEVKRRGRPPKASK